MVPEESSPDRLDRQVPWRSSQPTTPTPTNRLVVGDLVVYDQRASTITLIDPDGVPFTHWPAHFQARWTMSGESPEQWAHRPWRLTLEAIGKPWPSTSASDNGRFRNVAASPTVYWAVLPEHFAVCRICAELPPCNHEQQQQLLQHQQEQLRNTLDLAPDSCLGCGHTITARQKTISFSGPNLIRPDFGGDSAMFHRRRACREAVERYDRKLSAVTGSPLRFNCSGNLTVHANEDTECSRGTRCRDHRYPHARRETHRLTWGGSPYDDCWCLQSRNPESDTS